MAKPKNWDRGLFKPTAVKKDPATGETVRVTSPFWSGRFTDPSTNRRRTVPLRTADKGEAWELFQEIQREARLRRRGLADPHKQDKQRPLSEHVEDWRRNLLHEAGNTPRYVGMKVGRVLRMMADCRFELWSDINPDAVLSFLTSLATLDAKDTPEGKPQTRAGAKTRAHYAQSLGQFTKWMVANRRAATDPLAHLSASARSKRNKADVRHARREMTAEEQQWLLRTVTEEGRKRYGVAAEDRRRLYVMALATGMRSGEIQSIAWADLDLDAKMPTVTVLAAYAKNGAARKVWLSHHVVTMLREWRETRAREPARSRVFRTPSTSNVARMLRRDLEAAREAWLKDAKTVQERMQRNATDTLLYRDHDGACLDFHALRHTAASVAARRGATRHAMARQFGWQTVAMADRYAHASDQDAASVAAMMQDPEAEPVILKIQAG